MKEIVIPKDQAVFWLDRHGFWRNRHGRFERPRIIAKFHAAIGRDAQGYYLSQTNGDVREKIYFPYEDTALFVFDVRIGANEVT
ncbi:MAG: MFS transporter permease, partial [Desulfobacterales bacterium]|nr:MFS transporter permease [Desulfobacterales bacterium]